MFIGDRIPSEGIPKDLYCIPRQELELAVWVVRKEHCS